MLRWLLEKWLGAGPLVGVQVLRVKPGDVLVVRVAHVTRDQALGLKAGFGSILPAGVKVAVLEGGMDLTVVTGEVTATTTQAGG